MRSPDLPYIQALKRGLYGAQTLAELRVAWEAVPMSDRLADPEFVDIKEKRKELLA